MIKRFYFENSQLDTTIDLAYVDGLIPIKDEKEYKLELDEEDPIPNYTGERRKSKRNCWRYILNSNVNSTFDYKLKNIIESNIMNSRYGMFIESVDFDDNLIKIVFKDMMKINLKEIKK